VSVLIISRNGIEGIKCNVGQGGEKRLDCLGSNEGYGFIYS
jgi:hypothetical protein